MLQTIKTSTWSELVKANAEAVDAGWAERGVFATGIGDRYKAGGILYVGKSAGPLGTNVASGLVLHENIAASTRWMLEKRNLSAFWQMIDRLDPTRRNIAWTNICKMDEKGGKRPPVRYWPELAAVHIEALNDEIAALKPAMILMATSGFGAHDVRGLIADLGFKQQVLDFNDGRTRLYRTSDGRACIETRHPQGWPNFERDRVIELVRREMRLQTA